MAVVDEPRLQLHLEPSEPIEVSELTAALGSLARQYQSFAVANELAKKPADARLLVSSVSPGSIDISLLPDLAPYLLTAGMFGPLLDKAEIVLKFGKALKSLFDLFQSKDGKGSEAITIKDCDDAINITRPIASHGGSQTFNTINGGITFNILTMNASEATKILESATQAKALLQDPDAETRQRVPMVWTRLDRDHSNPAAKTTPDRALIEEIDPKPHAVHFTNEMSFLKSEMIGDEENPYLHIYFVDVQVSRVGGKVVSYRVVGYYGKDLMEEDE